MKKRMLAMALTVAMLLSLFPGQVFAAQTYGGQGEHSFTEVQPQTEPPTELVTESLTEALTEAPTEAMTETDPETHTECVCHDTDALGEEKGNLRAVTHSGHSNYTVKLTQDNLTDYLVAKNDIYYFKSTSYCLTDDITYNHHIGIDANVIICLNGHKLTITNDRHIDIQAPGKLTLYNCKADGYCRTYRAGSAIYVRENATLVVNGAYIYNKYNEDSSTGILAEGTVDFKDGKIASSKTTISAKDGSNVTITAGTFVSDTSHGFSVNSGGKLTMNGGSVTGKNCGISNSGTVTVNSGTVKGSSSHGISNSGTLTIEDGTVQGSNRGISNTGNAKIVNGKITGSTQGIYSTKSLTVGTDNTNGITVKATEGDGVGIYINGGTASVKRTTVSVPVTSDASSKGIVVRNSSELKMWSGTSVSGVTGVYVYEGCTFTMNTGNIEGVQYGINSGGTTTVNGGTIVGNTGIYQKGGLLTIKGAEINSSGDNKTYGIYSDDSSVTVGNTTINAVSNSNDIAYGVYQNGTFSLLDGVMITGGTADIYLPSGKTVTLAEDDDLTVPDVPEDPTDSDNHNTVKETYSVKTADTPTADKPVQITTTWNTMNEQVTVYPFTNTDYLVMKLAEPVANELYLMIPQVTLYLWKDHEAKSSKADLFDALMELDKENETYKLQSVTFGDMGKEKLGFAADISKDSNDAQIGYSFLSTGSGDEVGTIYASYLREDIDMTVNSTVELTVQVYEVKDRNFVLDYGLAFDITADNGVYVEDILPGTLEGGTPADEINTTMSLLKLSDVLPAYYSAGESTADNYVTQQFTTFTGKGAWGDYAMEDGKILFTPKNLCTECDTVYLTVRAGKLGTEYGTVEGDKLTFNPTKEVVMFKEIMVIPANIVYYEDNNGGLSWNPEEYAGIEITPIGSPTGDSYQDTDNSDGYGNDSDYAYAPGGNKYENGDYSSGGYSKKITVTETGPVLTFSFTGTGFDLIGSTTADSGQFMYKVTQKDASGKAQLVQSGALDTSYGAWDSASSTGDSAIHQVPLLHVQNLTHGTYDVLVQAVANYNWYAPQDQWVNGMPPVIPIYLYFDGVRVYNPMIDNRDEYIAGEATAEFVQIRELILNGKAAAAKIDENGLFSFGSGLISYVETAKNGMTYEGNKVTSLNDYLVAGPNNEAYFNEKTQTLVLYVRETGEEGVVPMMQIGVRNLSPETFGKLGDPVTAPELLLLGEKGATAQTLVSGEKAIGFTEQYYTVHYNHCVEEDINGVTYYRVVISSSKDAPFALSNLKLSGLEFYTIPASAASYKYDANGNLIETTNPNATTMPSLQELAWQLQAANGLLPEDDTESGTTEDLKFSSVSLSLQSSIGINFYVAKETLEQYTQPQILVTMEDKSLGKNGEGLVIDTYEVVTVGEKEYCVFSFNDITAKEMTHTVTATLKAKDEKGEVKTGETRDYSVVTYASNMLKKNIPDALKTLLVDMVNYGAEAQLRFACKTDRLANADFDAYQEYASETVAEYVSCSESTGAEDFAFSMTGVSLALNEKVEIGFFITPKTERDFTDTKLVVTYFDVSGNTVVKEIPYSSETFIFDNDELKLYKVVFGDLNATDMRTPVTAWLADKDGMRISNSKTYSIESYAASVKTKAEGGNTTCEAMMPLIDAMMKYGDAAQAYFGKTTAEAQ